MADGRPYTTDDLAVVARQGERIAVVEDKIRRLERDLEELRAETRRLRDADQKLLEPIYQLHNWGKQTAGFARIVASVVALISGAYGLVKLVGWI